MAKKKYRRINNRLVNIYADGSILGQSTYGMSTAPTNTQGLTIGGMDGTYKATKPNSMSSFGVGDALGVASGALNIAKGAADSAKIADTSAIEGKIDLQKSRTFDADSTDDLLNQWNSFSTLDNVSFRDVRGKSGGQAAAEAGTAALSGASAGMAFGPIGAGVGAVIGGLASGIGNLFGRRKAKKKASRLNKQIKDANMRAVSAFNMSADNLSTESNWDAEANYAAYGGPISMNYTGTMSPFGNRFAKGGGIHIKKANRGKFTEYCGGRVTSECIARGKRSSSPAVRKRATFAQNARGWNHAEGGPLEDNYVIQGDNIQSYAPSIDEPIERVISSKDRVRVPAGTKYSDLTQEQQMALANSDMLNKDLPLEIVSPEFDILTGLRGLNNLPKGFLKGNGKVNTESGKYYRQVRKIDKGIERAKSKGVIDTKPPTITEAPKKGIQLQRKTNFDVPFFSEDNLWYGRDPQYDIIVGGNSPGLEWMPITKHGGFRPDVKDIKEAYVRTTPLVNGQPNLAPSSAFEYYRHYPGLGMRNVTEGFPTPPITGLNTLYESNQKAFGGAIGTHGGDFSNGVIFIDNGGTHEENPNDGVQIEVDEQGTPNLVEEGEVVFNDYVFSNRLTVPDSVKKKYKLRGNTFADAAKSVQKESQERPNDPISKRGLAAGMARLVAAQEDIREAESGNRFDEGGPTKARAAARRDRDPIDMDKTYTDIKLPAKSKKDGWGIGLDSLRYAPVLGAGIGAITSLTKPDYGNAERIEHSTDNLSEVGFNPVGNYLTYKPLDRNYYLNKLAGNAGATRRAVVNQSNGNRATATAGILAADYNYNEGLGNLARQAEEYNLNQRQLVEGFNRGTNQFNSEGALKAEMANKENDKLRVQSALAGAQMREGIDARVSASRSANLTNFFDSLGDIGREEFARHMIKTNPGLYYTVDSRGNITYTNKPTEDSKSTGKKEGKNGGYLLTKGRRRR